MRKSYLCIASKFLRTEQVYYVAVRRKDNKIRSDAIYIAKSSL